MKRPTKPKVLDLSQLGFIEGLTLLSASDSQELCHYFGGIPYALPPTGPFRFRRPRRLPPCYRYGTRANPGNFTGGCSPCPQPKAAKTREEALLREEDCLQLNVWLPTGKPPKGGWPVLFNIHGGFLQFGDANGIDCTNLLSETDFKCMIVSPGYRLGVFGFLSSRELLQESGAANAVGNIGFWDQRASLEWTWKYCSHFGGDASNITIAGYSAGAYSTFMQLQYDLNLPDSKSIVRRAIMWSNGCGVQPKSLQESQEQFDELLYKLNIPDNLAPLEKLARLRAKTPQELLNASHRMQIHQFRAVTDGEFVRSDLFERINNGDFARQMKRRNVALMNGECQEEQWIYGEWRPPTKNSLESLYRRLLADYPRTACEALVKHCYPEGKLPAGRQSWKKEFGFIYADAQVYAMERGLAGALAEHGAGDLIHRYRIEWRAKSVDERLPKEWGVTHTSDLDIWFWGDNSSLRENEKEIAMEAFVGPFIDFVRGERLEWGTSKISEQRVLTRQGRVEIRPDDDWDRGQAIWRCLHEVRATTLNEKARL